MIAREVKRHHTVQDSALGLEVTVPVGPLNPLEHPVDGVGVGEDGPVSQSECSLALPKRATLSAAAQVRERPRPVGAAPLGLPPSAQP